MRQLFNQPEQLEQGMIAIVGIPNDENSSFLRGPALAPARIREVLNAGSGNLCAENGFNLDDHDNIVDVGDMAAPWSQLWEPTGSPIIEAGITRLLDRGARVLTLGGDHAITYPIVKAFAAKYKKLNILHLDAHADLYDELYGSKVSHACPFVRIMEQKLAARLVQVGVRTLNPPQQQQANRFGVEIVEMRDWQPGMKFDFDGPLYLSLDLDVLDPAFAPGISHHEPGGMSTRDVLGIIQSINAPLVGADIVELNPTRDAIGMTAAVAAKFLKEIVAIMAV